MSQSQDIINVSTNNTKSVYDPHSSEFYNCGDKQLLTDKYNTPDNMLIEILAMIDTIHDFWKGPRIKKQNLKDEEFTNIIQNYIIREYNKKYNCKKDYQPSLVDAATADADLLYILNNCMKCPTVEVFNPKEIEHTGEDFFISMTKLKYKNKSNSTTYDKLISTNPDTNPYSDFDILEIK